MKTTNNGHNVMDAEHAAMNARFNETLKQIVDGLNHLENEFYVNIGLNVGTMQINPSINNAYNDTTLIEFNGDEWVAHELKTE